MSYWFNAAVKGMVEGFTEFLPISSTGHLVLVRDLLPLTGDLARTQELNNLFDVVIQLPAILAIVILYWKRLSGSALRVWTGPKERNFWLSILAAFLPAAIVGFLIHDWLEALMRPGVVAAALIAGGVVLLWIEHRARTVVITRAEEVPLGKAVGIGLFQCLSMIPGTSRSGATIIGGRLYGLDKIAAAEFSFFLALPTMCGAFTLKFLKGYSHIQWGTDGIILLIGSISAFLTAWVVVTVFIRFLQKRSLTIFGWYRIVLGTLVLIWV